MKKIITLLLLLFINESLAAGFRFSELAAGDEVHISHIARDGYNWNKTRIQITSHGDLIEFTAQGVKTAYNSETQRVEETEIIDLGHVRLSANDITKLDRQFQAYREGGSVIRSLDRTEIDVEYWRKGERVTHENFLNIWVNNEAAGTFQRIVKDLFIIKSIREMKLKVEK